MLIEPKLFKFQTKENPFIISYCIYCSRTTQNFGFIEIDYNYSRFAPIAQWTERLTSNQKAAGSSPAGRTTSFL
jgi:hypothetical protein